MVEFGMNVQEACEAANIVSYQMQSSFGAHVATPGRLTLNERTPEKVRELLSTMGYSIRVRRYTSGPMNAVFFDWKHGTFWGGSSNSGEDYGIAW
jgi:gamma-glutamyltranspeptidase/glutathione hydrolase